MDLVNDGLISMEEASLRAMLTVEEFQKTMREMDN